MNPEEIKSVVGKMPVNTVLATVDGVNMKTVATGALFTVPVGYKAVITSARIRPSVITALVSVATIGIGIAAGEIDIINAGATIGLDAATKCSSLAPLTVSRVGVAGDIIKYGVTIGAVGTTYTASIDLIGYLIPA